MAATISPRFTPPTLGDNPAFQQTGRPNGFREQLVVPGQPAAAAKRPAIALGRIPIPSAAPQVETKPLAIDSEAIQREVESSKEYQALKRMGYIRERSDHESRSVRSAEPTAENDVAAEQGTVTSVEIEVHQELHIDIRLKSSIEQAAPPSLEPLRSDPLALDLNGNGLETTGVENGVRFDINADGRLDQTSFISGGDAFLALDANGNGRIDDGSELFGDQGGDANGYLALSRYDDNSDGRIDSLDAVFQQLRLFSLNSDGSQRLQTLAQQGISAISLDYQESDTALNAYDRVAQMGSFEREDGTSAQSGDLLLAYRDTE